MKPVIFILFLILAGALTAAPTFTGTPVSTDEGAQVRIAFTVSEYTDVTVYILDAFGKTVRHLAAGKLGGNPPASFAANSLSQEVLWDKMDDNGDAFSGAFEVRVGLGLTASFDRIYGWSGKNSLTGYIRGFAVDSLGNVYVTTSAYRGEFAMAVFNRNGDYVRSLHPYPGDLPIEKVKGFGVIDAGAGKWMPIMYQGHHGTLLRSMHGVFNHGMAITSKGWLVMPTSTGSFYGGTGPYSTVVMGTDGSCPKDTFYGPKLIQTTRVVRLAASPDGNLVYAAGIDNKVYRGELNTMDSAQPFLTLPGLTCGIAVDAQGRIYVSEYTRNRIRVFDASGALLDSCFMWRPGPLAVDPKSNVLYAMNMDTSLAAGMLVKFSSLPALDSVCAVALPWDKDIMLNRPPNLAVDYTAPHPIIWVGALKYGANELTGYTDNDTAFARLSYAIGRWSSPTWAGGTAGRPGYIAVDPEEKFLLAGCGSWSRVDLATGAVTASAVKGTEVAFGPDNTIYGMATKSYVDSTVYRYSNAGVRIALPNGAMEWGGPHQYCWGPDFGARGFQVTRNNDFYFFHTSGDARGGALNVLTVYDSMGVKKADSVIQGLAWMGGMVVAPSGALYAAYNVRPKGITYPTIFSGYFPDPMSVAANQTYNWPYSVLNYYLFQIGSIFKFSPAGGAIVPATGTALSAVPVDNLAGPSVPPLQVDGIYRNAYNVTGAQWQHFGISPSTCQLTMGDPSCGCFTPRFTVDGFGRVIYPDAFRFSVAVIDDNRNELLRIGEYGNPDQQGPWSARPLPAIPLAYPAYVASVNNHVYISDIGNQRIVRVRLGHDALWSSDSGMVDRVSKRAVRIAPLIAAFPMPFNPGVTVRLTLAAPEKASVAIYSAGGRLVKTLFNGTMLEGESALRWDGRNSAGAVTAAGTYILRATINGRTYSRNLVLAR